MKPRALRCFFVLFAGFFWSLKGYGQQAGATVRGIVTDTSGHALGAATVSLYAGKVMQKRVASSEKGFEFNTLAPGEYMITTSFSGYRTDTLNLVIKPGDTVINIRRIRLKITAIALREVQIKSEVPAVVLKGDTVIYNAEAFKTRPNSTVEELIRVLPGLEVDASGKITYQGKPIQYISINGKQYFLNDPTQISKNLYGDMVSKVELFDAPSKESIRTGIKDPDPGKALNLVIKKGVSLAINGKVYGGGTEKGNYAAGGNASSFVNDRAMFANINTNNINDLYTGQDRLEEAPTGIRGRSTRTSDGLTYSNKLNKLLSLNVNYLGGFDNTRNISSESQQIFYGADSTQLRLNSRTSTGTGSYHNLGGEVQFLTDSLQSGMIDYKPEFDFRQNKKISSGSSNQYLQNRGTSYLANSATGNDISNERNTNISNGLDFFKNMKKRTFAMNFSQSYFSSNTDGYGNSDTRFYGADGALLQDNQVKQQVKQESTADDYKLSLSEIEKITPSQSLSLTYAIATHHDETKRASYDFDAATNSYDLPDTLTTNDFRNANTTQNVNLSYSYNKGTLGYKIGGGLEHNLLESEDFLKGNILEKGFMHWTANASLGYRPGAKIAGTKNLNPVEEMKAFRNSPQKDINLDYNISSIEPTLDQWRPLPAVRNSLFIQIGNPGLKPEQDHNFSLRYSSALLAKGKSFQLSLSGRYRVNAIVQSIDLLPGGVKRSGYVNADGLYNTSANAVFELPIGNVKNGKIRISTTAGYAQDLSLNNGQKNVRAGLNAAQQFGALYRPGAKLQLNIDGNWRYDGSRNSLQPDRNTTSLIQNYRAGFSYELPGDARVSSIYGITLFGAQAGLQAAHTMIWNAALVKNVFKNKRGEFRFSAFDLLDSNSGISQGALGNTVFRSETNTPGRQLLLTFAYHFRPNQP